MIAVADYGMGNLLSVGRTLEHLGADVEVTSDPAVIAAAASIVLPGVGAFADAMGEIERRGLGEALRARAAAGVPLLGICLGMQLLFEESPEFGRTRGLGLIPGRVVDIPAAPGRRVPRIGWSALHPAGPAGWAGTILASVEPGEFAYFAHSYSVQPADPGCVVATADYAGLVVPAVVRAGAVWGTQFHPEKSGPVGLRILEGFLAAASVPGEHAL